LLLPAEIPRKIEGWHESYSCAAGAATQELAPQGAFNHCIRQRKARSWSCISRKSGGKAPHSKRHDEMFQKFYLAVTRLVPEFEP